MKTTPRVGDRPLPTPRQIYDHLDRFVIGQERAKRAVAIAAYNHLKRCNQKTPGGKRLIKKSNLLLIGPTGSGKTHIARTLAEFLGRLQVRVELDALAEDDLFEILTTPPDAVVKEYQALLKMDGVELKFEESALREVVRYALRRNTGARSLRTFIEEICHEVMFEAPERRGETIVIDAAIAKKRLEGFDGIAAREQ
jgi:ATP-dependent protease Clp ATPase subunit